MMQLQWTCFRFRDVAFINFASLGVRKVPQGSTQHQFRCHDPAVCSLRCYSLDYNYSSVVEVYMTFCSNLLYISPHVYSCSRAENHFERYMGLMTFIMISID